MVLYGTGPPSKDPEMPIEYTKIVDFMDNQRHFTDLFAPISSMADRKKCGPPERYTLVGL